MRFPSGQSTQTVGEQNSNIHIFQNVLSLHGNSQRPEFKILFFPLPKLSCFPITCNLTHPSSTSPFCFHLPMLEPANGEIQTQLQVNIHPDNPGSECELFPHRRGFGWGWCLQKTSRVSSGKPFGVPCLLRQLPRCWMGGTLGGATLGGTLGRERRSESTMINTFCEGNPTRAMGPKCPREVIVMHMGGQSTLKQ